MTQESDASGGAQKKETSSPATGNYHWSEVLGTLIKYDLFNSPQDQS